MHNMYIYIWMYYVVLWIIITWAYKKLLANINHNTKQNNWQLDPLNCTYKYKMCTGYKWNTDRHLFRDWISSSTPTNCAGINKIHTASVFANTDSPCVQRFCPFANSRTWLRHSCPKNHSETAQLPQWPVHCSTDTAGGTVRWRRYHGNESQSGRL